MNAHIVRAAMNMPHIELAATFGRVDGEEFGHFIFIFDGQDCGFIAELTAQDGSITEFATLDECDALLCDILAKTDHHETKLWSDLFDARNTIRKWGLE